MKYRYFEETLGPKGVRIAVDSGFIKKAKVKIDGNWFWADATISKTSRKVKAGI